MQIPPGITPSGSRSQRSLSKRASLLRVMRLRERHVELASEPTRCVLADLDARPSEDERTPQALAAIKVMGKHYGRPAILGSQPFQDLAYVIKLRDEIVHPKVESFKVFSADRAPENMRSSSPPPGVPLGSKATRRATYLSRHSSSAARLVDGRSTQREHLFRRRSHCTVETTHWPS